MCHSQRCGAPGAVPECACGAQVARAPRHATRRECGHRWRRERRLLLCEVAKKLRYFAFVRRSGTSSSAKAKARAGATTIGANTSGGAILSRHSRVRQRRMNLRSGGPRRTRGSGSAAQPHSAISEESWHGRPPRPAFTLSVVVAGRDPACRLHGDRLVTSSPGRAAPPPASPAAVRNARPRPPSTAARRPVRR